MTGQPRPWQLWRKPPRGRARWVKSYVYRNHARREADRCNAIVALNGGRKVLGYYYAKRRP